MVVANFGMGYRPNSEVVKTDDQLRQEYRQQQADFKRRLEIQEQRRATALQDYGTARVNEARQMGYTIPDDYAGLTSGVAGRDGYGSSYILNPSNFNVALGSGSLAAGTQLKAIEPIISSIQGFAANSTAAYNDITARRQEAQPRQQETYNANQIGAAGGVLPGISHQGTLDPTQAASWNTPWMQPGFGNPGSLGGLGGYNPQNGQSGQNRQQQNGWGGVFGNKNPWSMA